MKILLVGLGDWGSKHLRVWQTLPVELLCCDQDPARQPPGARFATSHRNLLAEAEAVVIATPGPGHYALAAECLEAGKDIFVEKPLALSSAECRDLTQLAAKRGRIAQVGHIFRFDAATTWLREALRAGKFGRPLMLRGRFAGFKRPRRDGGSMISDAIHFVDLFNFILDSTPRAVLAVRHDFLGRGFEDAALLSLEFAGKEGPVWATIETDYFTPGKHREVTIAGGQMSAVCDYSAEPRRITTFQNHHENGKAIAGPVAVIETPGPEPLRAELTAFLECVRTRQPPRAEAAAGWQAARVLEAAAESAQTGRRVDVK